MNRIGIVAAILALITMGILLTGCGSKEVNPIELLYDDRKPIADLVGKEASKVEITEQAVTSKQIGTDTADENVLVYEDGTVYAVGTGTATLVVDGKSYPVTVKAAPLSRVLITGHSIGAGQAGNGEQSVAIEAGQVYSSYGRSSLTSAEGGLGYGSTVRAGGLSGTEALDAFAPSQGGNRGVGSALGYQWNKLTGEKVWVMNLAIPGSCINEWLPGVAGWHYEKDGETMKHYAYKYESVLEHFGYAQQIMTKEIAAGHYTLSHMTMFYFSGANFGNANYQHWTHDSVKTDYETMWNGLKKDLAMDMNGDGKDETLEAMGIVPIWTKSNKAYQYDKALNYIMAASADYPDVFIASDLYRDWLDINNLASFPAIDYTTQSVPAEVPLAIEAGTAANTVFMDDAHLSQVTYNAIGLDMAAVYNNLCGKNNAVTTIELQYVNGQAVPDTIQLKKGEQTQVIVPVLTPEYGGDVSITVNDNLKLVWPLIIEGAEAGTGTVTFTAGDVTKTLTVEVTG